MLSGLPRRDLVTAANTGFAMYHDEGRGYETRWKILQANDYDPHADIVQDAKGVFNLAGNKPQLRDQLRAYFTARNEDTVEL
jgi:hypothetical protein